MARKRLSKGVSAEGFGNRPELVFARGGVGYGIGMSAFSFCGDSDI